MRAINFEGGVNFHAQCEGNYSGSGVGNLLVVLIVQLQIVNLNCELVV